ncbi:MAG: ABC transporter permease [Acidobacteriota bacterium]|nr:ABC transporter permease [Acidobacteriota bacterium]
MRVLLQDIVYGMRQLRKTPGFTITVLLTLALGIGANAAIFTLVNAVLLRSLPVADPSTLVRIGDTDDCCVNGGINDSGDYSLFSTQTYYAFKKNLPEFQELAAMESGYGWRPLTVRRAGPQAIAKSVMGTFVSGNYFRVFGLTPAAGRFFLDADDKQGAAYTAVMSYETWQQVYDSDPSVVGSTFYMNTKPVTIIGIAPKGFFGDRISSNPPEYYLPLESMDDIIGAPYMRDPEISWAYVIGRIKPGVSIPALQQKVSGILRQEFASQKLYQDPKNKKSLARTHVKLTPGGGGIQNMQQQYKEHLQLLTWIAGLVLLVACANIANLMLVRGMSRRAEISVRSALGAPRLRIIRQLLTESVLLATLGGALGLGVSYLGVHALLVLAFPGEQAVPINAAPSPLVVAFSFGLALVTGILFGLAPALIAASTQPAEVLRSNARTTAQGASILQRSLVVLQAALSLVLLVVAGLFTQSLNKAQGTNMHLDATNRYIIHINPQAAGYSTTQVEALYRTIVDNFHAIPGVVKVGLATYTPMEQNNWSTGIKIQGQADPDKGSSWVKATPEYFDAVGTHVLMGRGFTPDDKLSAPPVAVVNQEFVKQFFNGKNPIGHRFGSPSHDSEYEIVGVVENTTYTSVYWKNHVMYFVPMTQRPKIEDDPIEKDLSMYAGAIVVQTARPVPDMEKLAYSTLTSINPNLTIAKFQTFQQQIDDNFTQERLIARLTSLFGVIALLLAAIGLYGVTAYTVVRRTPEIGIRMALGAERVRVIGMVMRGAMLQALVGLLIGAPIALVCIRWVKSQLYDITSVDPRVLAGAIAILAAATAIAGLIPAKRAASIDPARALRTE